MQDRGTERRSSWITANERDPSQRIKTFEWTRLHHEALKRPRTSRRMAFFSYRMTRATCYHIGATFWSTISFLADGVSSSTQELPNVNHCVARIPNTNHCVTRIPNTNHCVARIGCLRFTKFCWVGKHLNVIMKATNSPAQGHPNTKKK